jgi:acetyl-CoA synthetase
MIQMEALHRIMNCTNVFAKMANVLKEQGIQKEIVFVLPMIPECLITTLACARIGAIHSVVFAGFSASAVAAESTTAIKWSSPQMVAIGNKTIDLKVLLMKPY